MCSVLFIVAWMHLWLLVFAWMTRLDFASPWSHESAFLFLNCSTGVVPCGVQVLAAP